MQGMQGDLPDFGLARVNVLLDQVLGELCFTL
jgi:hypothetical protein